MVDRIPGFSYSVSLDQINRYKEWPIERRLKWLFYGNKLRKYLPDKTIEVQEAFRKGTPLPSRQAVSPQAKRPSRAKPDPNP
jgi:hypothetical protein